MLNQVETMFDDMEKMIKKLKKKQYEENMENFMAAYEAYFLEMETYMSENDPQTAAKEISQVFVDAVKKRYEVKGKIDPKRLHNSPHAQVTVLPQELFHQIPSHTEIYHINNLFVP